jgi:hypothetical protein
MASKGASALTGAGTGAAIGSVAGPIGTAAGAVIGGIGGYLLGGDDEAAPTYNPSVHNFQYGLGGSGTYASTQASKYAYEQQQLAALGAQAYNRGAPTQGLPDRRDHVGSQGQSYLQGADAGGRASQIEALGGLQNQTSALNRFAQAPMGPSAAQAQLQAGTDSAARQQYGFARSQVGGGGAALRNAAFNAAGISGNAANQAAALRAQETQAYRAQQLQALGAAQQGAGMSAGYSGQLRGMDQGFAQTQAGQANYDANSLNAYNQQQQQLQFGVGQNNLNAQLSQGRANDAMLLSTLGMNQGYYGMTNNLAAGQQSAGQNYESARLQGAGLGSSNFNAAQQQSNTELAMGLGAAQGGLAAYNQMNPPAGGGAGTNPTSDIRAKENIRPVSAAAQLSPHVQGEVDRVQYLRALGGGDPSLTSTAEFAPSPNLRPAQGYEYSYRDPQQHGEGRYVGPMAQNLEHLPGVVEQGSDGIKSVNAPRLTLANTAAVSEQQRRIDELEMQLRALGGSGGGMVPALRSQAVYAQPQGTGGL